MRQLKFLEPKDDIFLKYLRDVFLEKGCPILLVGKNELAGMIKIGAEKKGIELNCIETFDGDYPIKDDHIIVFTQISGALLSKQLMTCIELDNVTVVAPITDWHYSQKPLFLISIPKAGTHLVYELAKALGYSPGIQLPDCPQGKTWYCIEYTNSHTVARDFFVDTVRRAPFGNRNHPFIHSPTLFIYRHPLDILVSEAHYYHCDGKTAFAGWLSQYDFEERAERLGDDNWLLGSLRERIGGFLPWMDFSNVISFSFEELIGAFGGSDKEDQLRLIWSIQLKLQAPGITSLIATQVFNPESPTFRSAQIGKFKECLSVDMISAFCTKNKDILGTLGYSLDGKPGLPSQRTRRLHRPVGYSKSNFSDMPLTIEADFLECNLVRLKGRVYAVPKSAGPIAINELAPEILASLPVADGVENLKVLLSTGYLKFSRQQKKLIELGVMLKDNEFVDGLGQQWSKHTEFKIVDIYKGFNIIVYNDYYVALKQSGGRMDLVNSSIELLKQHHGEDIVLSATSIAMLHSEIDFIQLSKSLSQELTTANEREVIMMESLQTDQKRLVKRIASLEQKLSLLESNIESFIKK